MANIDKETLVLIYLALTLWSLPWKGVAMWKAARLSHDVWFILMLVFQTAGILEIIYIFAVANKYTVESEETIEIAN